ncbi:hypothetical protein NM688_g6125 [Phlebia brevispora]|uniref:Uncharacterized protein n=1 Tax=Phlebia brevispora TaxID=194682 RepID=A0ACC1SJJ2_9APHY|nr:hypothetical protein NM688_g6125 [Phlebia brevispora]
MPKITNSTPHVQQSTPFKNNIHSLKRNQACHQCRKRKLKCDAKRPCSTCVRSHSYALAHASGSDRAALPQHPECTYDEISTAPPVEPTPPAPKNRYERLESRINELESLLREKSTSANSPPASDGKSASSTAPSSFPDFGFLPAPGDDNVNGIVDMSGLYSHTNGNDLGNMDYAFNNGTSLDHLAGIASLMDASPPETSHIATASTPSTDSQNGVNGGNGLVAQSPNGNPDMSLLYLSWPSQLPDIFTTRHLIHAFFTHHIHASRLFHQPTFLAALDLHPSDPKFPCRAVIHAMCAVGSLYSGGLLPASNISDSYPYDAMTGERRKGKQRISSFGDQQAKHAKLCIEESLDRGENLFECCQAQIILTWFYLSQARWVEACLSAALATRSTIPCALNVCPPFHGISASQPFSSKPPTILHSAKTVIEDEVRRNTFWVAYSMEREQGAGNGWAMNLDDRDVSQLLPLRLDQFLQGTLVLPPGRQWSHDKDVLSVHREDQMDSFIMFVKCSILISRVKNFNLRFKSLAYTGDPSVIPPTTNPLSGGLENFYPKDTPAFRELDELVSSFKASFPPDMKSPMTDDKLDPYLYSAWNMAHLASILLHEPFARPGSYACISAYKILTSSRAIVELLHQISSTSYDVSSLDLYPFLCWFMAGRVLVRFLKAAQDAQAQDQVIPLQTEINFLRAMLSKAGERIPLAYRYSKMLYDTQMQTCGPQEPAVESPPALPPRDTTYVTSQYDYTAMLFSYKTPPMPPPPENSSPVAVPT